jgi:hypothetical protein
VRWRIYQPGDVPMGIAGISAKWRDTETGLELIRFAMLTVNAKGHPVMRRFHRGESEKRMVVILHPREYNEWLACPGPQAPKFFRPWDGADGVPRRYRPGRHVRTVVRGSYRGPKSLGWPELGPPRAAPVPPERTFVADSQQANRQVYVKRV